jgi:phage shock protein A
MQRLNDIYSKEHHEYIDLQQSHLLQTEQMHHLQLELDHASQDVSKYHQLKAANEELNGLIRTMHQEKQNYEQHIQSLHSTVSELERNNAQV